MKKLIVACSLFTFAAIPSFAQESPPEDTQAPMKYMHPGMMHKMSKNPQHQLAMAYHKNLVGFGKALKKMAMQGKTIPQDFARVAVDEMKRSAQQMEKYHAACLSTMPPEAKAKMTKMMNEHMATAKKHLAALDQLVKGDTIESKKVIEHLDPLLMGCEAMSKGPMHDEGKCSCCGSTMYEHRKMMEDIKAQDAELSKKVADMNRASKDEKVELMADILSRLVQQKTKMDAAMGTMHSPMMKHMHGHSFPCMESMPENQACPDEGACVEK